MIHESEQYQGLEPCPEVGPSLREATFKTDLGHGHAAVLENLQPRSRLEAEQHRKRAERLEQLVSDPDYANLDKRFAGFAPKPEQRERYDTLRSSAKYLAEQVIEFCPASRERSLALTGIEQAVMWASTALARGG